MTHEVDRCTVAHGPPVRLGRHRLHHPQAQWEADVQPRLRNDLGGVTVAGAAGVGCKRIGNEGYFFEPTVMTDVPRHARIMNEEPFGPIAVIHPFDTFESAVAEANRLACGLAAYAYTHSAKTAAAVGAAVESGMVSINHHGLALPEIPFGGVKDSGYGSEGGTEAMDAYLNVKLITQVGL